MRAQAGSAALEMALLAPYKAPQHTGPTEKNGVSPDIGANKAGFEAFGQDGLTFWDFLDIINPLQHIPVISTLYRSITGDEIDPAAKIAGGTLYGGPIGAISSLIDVVVDYGTGKDIGEHAMTLVQNEPQKSHELPKTPPETTEYWQDNRASNPYLAHTDISEMALENPVNVSAYAVPSAILAQDLSQNHAMHSISVARRSLAEQIAAYSQSAPYLNRPEGAE